jgi:hypothetical protein
MEASERPQLSLDETGDATVRVVGDRLVVENLSVSDECAARVVRERAASGHAPADTVTKAVEIGARVLENEETTVNVDYVQKALDRGVGKVSQDLSQQAEEMIEGLAESIAASFGSERSDSVQAQIKEIVAKASEEQRLAIARLFSAEDGANPLTDFKAGVIRALQATESKRQAEDEATRKRIEALTREIVELKDGREADRRVAEAEEAGTRKGRSFEELVFAEVDRIAAARGDAARHVGDTSSESGSKKGDVVIEVDGATGTASTRVVIEVKNKKLSKNDAWAEMNASMTERDAAFALLVVAGEDKIPSGLCDVTEYQGNKMIVALDREDPDPGGLGLAYRYARARALMMGEAELALDAARVRDSAEQAGAALKRANTIRKALTGVRKGEETARDQLEDMIGEVERCLATIESLVAAAEQ